MLVDTHAHLMDTAFASDLADVLDRAAGAGVRAIVCVGYDEQSSRQAVELASRYPQIAATVGVHPNYAGQAGPGDFQAIRQLARHPRVVGIGETGLDNVRQYTAPAVQRDWFHRHLDLAAETNLPVIVHNREADDETASTIVEWAASTRGRGVLHCFSGSSTMLDASARSGFMTSFAGPVTFKSAAALHELARQASADRLLVETDCPYLTPAPHRGKRNEPAHVRHTAEQLALLRGVSLADIADQTTANAVKIFPMLDVLVSPGATS